MVLHWLNLVENFERRARKPSPYCMKSIGATYIDIADRNTSSHFDGFNGY
jgi:hypothetical protein